MVYNFEWDPQKARSNMEKHRVRFEEAGSVFRDPRALSMFDPDHSEAEDRWVTLGIGRSGRLLLVCHTFRDDSEASVTIRIYSARRPTAKETQAYEKG